MTTVRVPARAAGITLAQFDVLNTRAAELRAAGHDVISLGQALPRFGPPPAALAAMRAAVDVPATHVYSADAGLHTLREALCARLNAEGASVTPDDVIVTAGGNQAFMLALMTLVDPGDEVLLPSPYFVNHQMAIAAFGAVAREVSLDERAGFALRWADLVPHVSSRTRAVVICTPSNPTGAIVPRAELARIGHELAARGIVLFSDETYGRFVYDGAFPSVAALPSWRENAVVVSTFSKTFGMTGWRAGYLLAAPHVCDQAIKIQDAMIICAPVPSQVGVEAAIRESWDYPAAFMPELVARRAQLARGLQDIPRLHWTSQAGTLSGGFFALVRVDGCRDSAALATEILDRAHVVTIPGATFGSAGEGFLRLSYSAVSDDDLGRALGRLRTFFGRPEGRG